MIKFTRMINFRKLNRVWEFLSFLTGSREREFEDERKRSVLAFFMIVGIGITFPFAIHHFSIGNVTGAIRVLCLGSVQFASLIALRYLRRANIIFRLNVLLLGIYFLFLIYLGGPHGSRILWIFIFPIFAFFLLGKSEGLFWSVLLILFSLLLFINPSNFFGTFPYESEIKTRFVVSYTILVLMAYFFEATRQRYQEGFQDYAAFQTTLATIRGMGPDKSEADFWQVFLSSIVKEYGFLMAWYGRYSDGQVVPENSAGRVDRYLDDLVLEIREPTSPDARCAMSRAILDGQPFGYEDLANDEGFRSWRDYALELGYCSNVALPFKINGRIEGGIMIYAGTTAAFPAKRVDHLFFLTSEIENTLQERRQAQQAKVALQNSYDQLERRVEERTADLKDANEQLKQEVLERKQAEEALQKSEERFRELAENIREVFWLFDWKEQRVLYVSPAYEEIWGRSTQDLYNHYEEWGQSIHPDDVAYAEKSFNKILESGGGEDREYRIVRSDGEVRWLSDRGFTITDEDGQVRRIAGIAEDITERKRIEDELKSNEKFLQDIFDGIQDGISVLDSELNIIRVNQWMEKMYLSSSPLVGKKCHEVYQGRDDLCPWCPSIHTLKSGKAHTEVVPFPSADNPEGWLELSSFPIKNMAGAITGVIEHVKNITERKKAEDELTRHREHLEELVKERTKELDAAHDELLRSERLSVLGQLTATVSHELRNPLGVIRSSSFYLQRKYKGKDEKVKKHMSRIEDQVEICDSIVGDLLEFTRGRHSQMVEGEINPWLEQIIDEIPESAMVKIEKVLDNDLPNVHFDKEKMRRVVVNLMDNALQAIKEKKSIEKNESYQPAIEVSSKAKDADIVIMVKDNGIGMDEETMKRAFEPLFTTRARGTGLGLANVEKILHEHNGNILLKSKPHDGTTAIVTIPTITKE